MSFVLRSNPPKLKVLDELEPLVADGGVVLDWHTCDIFPERWIDLVVVLRCDHSQLWNRLEKRFTSLLFHFLANIRCFLEDIL